MIPLRTSLRHAFAAFALAIAAFAAPACAGAIVTGAPLRADVAKPFTGDFDAMVAARRIRVLIPFSRLYFHLDRGEPSGVAVSQIEQFEKQINAGIRNRSRRIFVFVVPTPRDRLLSDLVAGRGDVALGNLTVTEERKRLVAFSRPLATGVRELVVTAPTAPEIVRLDDLSGRTITVRRSSSFRESLERANAELAVLGRPPIVIRAADERLETEDLIEMVQAGLIEATVADDHMLDLWVKIFPGIRVHTAVPLRSDGEIAWAFRRNSPVLAARIDAFVATAKIGTEAGNIRRRDHLASGRWLKPATADENVRRLRSHWGHFRTYGDRYGIDPTLIAAVAFQESRFDPGLVMRRSGATGIMQMMPSTARLPIVGITDLRDPEQNIHAFAKYFAHLRAVYVDQPGIGDVDRLMLVLASYNAGPTRIARLRRISRDPNVWFESVEWAVWRDVGSETVDYVRNVFRYYVTFRAMSEGLDARRTPPR